MLEVERSEAVQVAFPEVSPTLEDKLSLCRPRVHGKFLFVGDEKLWIRGVTYGTFKPDYFGVQFPQQDVVERDFRAIADAGLNAIRVYTAPPLWLMHAAAACRLRVMIGLPWEQHVTFLDDRRRTERILN